MFSLSKEASRCPDEKDKEAFKQEAREYAEEVKKIKKEMHILKKEIVDARERVIDFYTKTSGVERKKMAMLYKVSEESKAVRQATKNLINGLKNSLKP